MDFSYSERQRELLDRLRTFMAAHVVPAEATFAAQLAANRWQPPSILGELKVRAKEAGLWNLFLPPSPAHDHDGYHGAGLSNLDYAPLAEEMGRIVWASEIFNCSAPDTGNMEILHRCGTPAQRDRWLRPLLDGDIRSAYAMTEPDVASSDATNVQTRIIRQGNDYVIS